MPRVITGTKSHKQHKKAEAARKQVRIVKAHGGNIQKFRCPFCGTLAHPIPDGKGGTKLHCSGCKKDYQANQL